ncbi:39S ribosomal protein L34, mitochondrial isoform X1 [Girardinichthys multiradiatus]|uniref:39S ribosomal protein L34, mitochondrial isoform X1 n=1 Tax=Girardinichthys multiradiatus TaxID=208333 RepID=UPI001FAE63E0|nr:39S ribosomal protein L34, mitochondrial isoform X1 [Girardinichthys multiradiatus]
MNIILSSISRLRGVTHLRSSTPTLPLSANGTCHLRFFSSWFVSGADVRPQVSRLLGPPPMHAEGGEVFQQHPWQYQQVRTRKRGTEYQPKNIKRKRTHGWIKRLSSKGGIEVILRRMLKGRKSLSH